MSLVSRRWARRLLFGCALVLGVLVVAFALLQTSPVATWVVRRLLPMAPLNPGYGLEVGRVSGNWITHLQLEDVRLTHQGRELARIAILRAGYDPRRLRGPELKLNQLAAYGVTAVAHREAGEWDLANAFRRSADTTGGGGFAVGRLDLRKVQVAAHVGPDSTLLVRDLQLRARDFVAAKAVLLTLDTLGARMAPPAGKQIWLDVATRGAATEEVLRLDPLRLTTQRSEITGSLVIPRSFSNPRQSQRLAVDLHATPLALADLAAALPGVRASGSIRIDASASAPGGRVANGRVVAQLERGAIRLEGTSVLGSSETMGYSAYGEIQDLDPSRVLTAAPAGRLNGELDAKISGSALGRADGKVGLRFNDSRLAGTIIKRLGLSADLADGRAKVSLRGEVGTGTVEANGWIRPFDSIPSYDFSGGIRRIPGTDSIAVLLAGSKGEPVLDLSFRLAGEGASPNSARVSGRADLAAVRRSGDRDSLGHATISLANGRLVARPRADLAGGNVTAVATVRFGDTLRYELREGAIERVNLGQLLGDTVAAPLSGSFSLRGRGVAPEQVVGSARLELDTLRYGARRIDGMVALARLDKGALRVESRASIQGGRLALDADARPFDSVRTAVVRDLSLAGVDLGALLGRPDLAGRITIDARGAAGLQGDRLTYQATVGTNAGSFAVAGDALPFAPVPSFAVRRGSIDSLNLGVLMQSAALNTALNGRFTALSGGAAHSLRARFEVQLLPSRINQATLRSGTMRFTADRGSLGGDVRVQSPDGELAATVTGRTGNGRRALRAKGAVDLDRLAHWTGRDSSDGRIASRFDLLATADSIGLLTVDGGITAAGRVGNALLDSLLVVLRPRAGVVRIDTVLVRSNVARLDGGGGVALRTAAAADTLRLNARAGDLMPLAALAGMDSISLDSSRISLTLAGPAGNWGLQLQGEAHQLLYGSNLAQVVRLRGTGTVDGSGLRGIAGNLRLEGAAFGRTAVRELDLSGRYDSLFALQARAKLQDSVELDARLRGVRSGDSLHATLEQLQLDGAGQTWALERPASLVFGPRIEVNNFALHAGQSRFIAEGVLNRKGSSDLSMRFDRMDLETFRALGFIPIGGRLDGWLHLTGQAATPSLTGRVRLGVRGPRANQELGRIQSDLDWSVAGLRVNASAAPARGGPLTVTGTLPWRFTLAPADTTRPAELLRTTSDTLGLVVRADSFGLDLFNSLLPPETARDLGGALAMNAKVAGTLSRPLVNGTVRLSRAGVTLPALDITYQKGEFAGTLINDRLRVDSVRVLTGKKETLTATGWVNLKPLDNPALDLTAHLSNFRVSNAPPLRAIASGEVQLRGTAEVPTLTGRLTLGRSELLQGGEAIAADVEKVELTPQDRLELARNFGPAALAHVEEQPGLVDRFRLDLDVRLPRRVWFRRQATPKIDIELSGRLNVRQEPGQPMEFVGKVEPSPERSLLEVSGREFRVTRGDITLAGPVDSTLLDVTAEYQVPTQGGPESEVIIDVAAKGRPDSLNLEFSSQPSMSQEDIISYIATGRPASDNPLAEGSGGGASAGELGATLAANRLSQRLSTTASEKLGLDVFQIKQDGLRGLTLTAGRYVGRRLFLSLQQPIQLSGDARQEPGTNLGPGFELEYSMRRWLRANLRGGSLPPRFFLRYRYAY